MRVHVATRDKIRVGFAMALLLAGVIGAVSYRSMEQLVQTQLWVAHTHEVREQIQAVRAALAERTYVRGNIEVLQTLTADNPRQQKNITTLKRRIVGKARMESLRPLLADMDAEEARLLDQRRHQAEMTAGTAKDVIVMSGVLAFALVLAAILIIERDLRQQQAHERILEEANARLETLATRDGLTDLANQRMFHERLEEEFQRARRYNTGLSLLILDVDRFKQFNDSFGHPAGDAVLQSIAQILREEARGTDVVARHGGEEFAVLMPDTDADGAVRVGERIRGAIERHPWPYRSVTASLGATTMTSAMTTPSELVAEADRALYLSKGNGRNLVTHAHQSILPLTLLHLSMES